MSRYWRVQVHWRDERGGHWETGGDISIESAPTWDLAIAALVKARGVRGEFLFDVRAEIIESP